MTIGIFLNSFCEGGIERVVARLIPNFYQMGYDVVILSALGADCDVMSDIPPHKRIVIGNGLDRGSRLAAALHDFKIEICIIENYLSPTVLSDCEIITSIGVPYVVHFHSVFSTPFLLNLYWIKEKEYYDCYSKASALITLSRYDEYFFRLLGCNAHYFFNPVDDVPSSFNREESKNEILWLGRFDEQKKPLDAIKIFTQVLNRIPDAKLIMVGGLDTVKGREVKSFVKSSLQLRNSVLLVGFAKDVWTYYSTASVFLSTAAYEGFACTFMEAAAAGIPIVGYDLPYCELVNGNDGYISINQGDVDSAADAICRLLKNDAERFKLGAANRATFERIKAFDQAAAYCKLFEDIKLGARVGSQVGDGVAQLCLKTLAEHAMLGHASLKNIINSYFIEIKRLKRSKRHKNRIITLLVVIIIVLLMLIFLY
jgi:glycosyltransferase involved in cell wall biosynthesis